MTTAALVDLEAKLVYYLAFNLLLAEAPIRGGAIHIEDSHVPNASEGDPATAARHAAVRAALLTHCGAGSAALRDTEIARAATLARAASVSKFATVPDEDVRQVTLNRSGPTSLDQAQRDLPVQVEHG
jgi:hypothetical protein